MEGVTHGIREKKVIIRDGKVTEITDEEEKELEEKEEENDKEKDNDKDKKKKPKYQIKSKYGLIPVYEKNVKVGVSKCCWIMSIWL